MQKRVATGTATHLLGVISKKFQLLSVAQVGNQVFDTGTSGDKLYQNHSTMGFPHNCKYSKKEMEG